MGDEELGELAKAKRAPAAKVGNRTGAEPEDMALLEAWRNGDGDAGAVLFRRYFQAVYVFFQSKLHTNVEDLVQQTFLGCVEAGDRLDELASFKAYLFGIARCQLLRFFSGKKGALVLGDIGEVACETLNGPSKLLEKDDQRRLLLRALRQIPIDLQIAVELFYWEQLSLVEIAAVVEIPAGTVKSRLFRAKQLLRDRIAELADSDDLRTTTLHNLEHWAGALRKQLGEKLPPPNQGP